MLPERVLADAQHPEALGYQQINDATRGGMEVVVNPPCALGRDALQTPTCVYLSQLALQLRTALVVELVDGFHWPPVDDTRYKAWLV